MARVDHATYSWPNVHDNTFDCSDLVDYAHKRYTRTRRLVMVGPGVVLLLLGILACILAAATAIGHWLYILGVVAAVIGIVLIVWGLVRGAGARR
jgi:protein-S-isoprenylcysteine O-methyltransferase Ste14